MINNIKINMQKKEKNIWDEWTFAKCLNCACVLIDTRFLDIPCHHDSICFYMLKLYYMNTHIQNISCHSIHALNGILAVEQRLGSSYGLSLLLKWGTPYLVVVSESILENAYIVPRHLLYLNLRLSLYQW